MGGTLEKSAVSLCFAVKNNTPNLYCTIYKYDDS
jgi:hypothetical protein